MERENLENSTIRNVKKNFHEKIKFLFIGQGQVDTWYHLRGFSEASPPRNLKFSNKMAILHEIQNFAWLCEIKKTTTIIYAFLEHFAWLCEIFAWSFEISFEIPFGLQHKSTFWSISHSHAKWKYLIFKLSFCHFFHFLLLIPLQLSPNPKSWSKPIALLFSLCIWIIINFICSFQFDSSLLSSIYQNHTLKWLQNFIKLVSNSCKGNNMLTECFRHNYYSKDVKLMRIII